MATSADSDRLIVSKSGAPLYGRTDGVGVIRNASSNTVHDGLVAISNGSVTRTLDPSLLCEVFEDFIGNIDLPKTGDTVVNTSSPWFLKDTSSAGSPTFAIVGDADNGQLDFHFDSQNEVQSLTLYWKDEQCIDSDQEPVMVVRLQLPAQFSGATVGFVAGFGSAQNDTVDSVADNAWVKVEGANLNLLLESDNNTTDTDDKDTGVDLVAATWYEFMISCSALHGASVTDIRYFYRATLGGDWTPLNGPGTALASTTFKMRADQAIQPLVQFYKNSAGTDQLLVDYVRVYWKRN